VLERLALDIFLDRPVLDLPLQADELALLERLGEAGEIAPGLDAVPFGARFVFALVALALSCGSAIVTGSRGEGYATPRIAFGKSKHNP